MFTHGAIAGGTGGVYFYIMLRRERQRAEAAERRLDEERRRADRERRRADRERQQLLNRIAALEALTAQAPSGGDEGQEQPRSE